MKVSFCEHNIASKGIRTKLIQEHPEIETSLNKCIGECGSCGRLPIVRVDGKYLECETEDEMYKTIVEMSTP